MNQADIIIIGAGAAGLMAARELSRTGKKVLILEARSRTGGRIFSLDKESFGYPSEGGAEFVHGDLPLTKSLLKEAGLTLLPAEGEFWNSRNGKLTKHHEFIPNWDTLLKKLMQLKEDISIAQFLDENFPLDKNEEMHNAITGFVEGYDAADPERASAFALRDEWTSENNAEQYRIKEGYGALIKFLETQARQKGSELVFNSDVKSIQWDSQKAIITCDDGTRYQASKVILTVPLPILTKLNYIPPIPDKIKAAAEIGFGKVIKFLFRFKSRWWAQLEGTDLSKAGFIFSQETVPTWWTQYPEEFAVLTGWLAGPNSEQYIHHSEKELLELGISSLSKIFQLEKEFLKKELLHFQVVNWGNDPFALGAYAYATPETAMARNVLLKSVNKTLYFSGEALYEGKEMGTVEAALASGLRTALEIINQD